MDIKSAKKLSYIVNTVLLFFVLLLWGFFYICDASFLVSFSVPTTCIYLINYALIKNNKLDVFVWITYFWIAFYMSLATLFLGFEMGFHLYSMSLVMVIFCSEYIAHNIRGQKINSIIISVGLALIYICCTGFALWNGPIYETPKLYKVIMLTINACIVFSFLIVYSSILLGLVKSSEKKLENIALVDKLTGLYNRHHMMDVLDEKVTGNTWIALVDIDDFKKINDTYGHNAGDYVLVYLSEALKSVCTNCTVSRWGGEEFLLVGNDSSSDISVLEKLRLEVSRKPVAFDGNDIPVTITIGVSMNDGSMNVDQWIHEADTRLYTGKNNGKNVVIGAN